MDVLMLETRQGSPNGIIVNTYEKDQTYSVPEELAAVFLRERWATDPATQAQEPATTENEPSGNPENTPEKEEGTPLSDAFPGKVELEAAGHTTLEQVVALSDEDLIKVPGIGQATIEKIKAALKDGE